METGFLIRFVSTRQAICEALDCQPGDILEYDPKAEDGGGDSTEHGEA